MVWMTIEEIKKAAQGTEREAALCSLKHWQQMRDASFEEFVEGWREKKINTKENHCALCVKYHCWGESDLCCLPYCGKDGSVWCKAQNAFNSFAENPTRQNFAKFQDCADAMCKVIEEAIAKLENVELDKLFDEKSKDKKCDKPELRHCDYGYDYQNDPCMIIELHNGFLKDVNKLHVLDKHDDSTEASPQYRIETKLGNTFDDLERNSKDLEEFDAYSCTDSKVTFGIEGGEIGMEVKVNKTYFNWDIDVFTKIHQKLGQLICTARREKAK